MDAMDDLNVATGGLAAQSAWRRRSTAASRAHCDSERGLRGRSLVVCCESGAAASEAPASLAQRGVGGLAWLVRCAPAGSRQRGCLLFSAARGCGRAASIWRAVRALCGLVLGVEHLAWRMRAPDSSERGVSRTRPRTSGEALGRARRLSPRRACRRCARAGSLEDLRGAVAALEAHLVGAGGAGGAVVEIDEEVVVDLHPTIG